MGIDVCDKHAAATPNKPGLIVADPNGKDIIYTFKHLKTLSNKLANVMIAKNVSRGDRLGIFLGQSVEAAIAHIAAWKMGAISIPLFTLFGEDALKFRLIDSGARMLITDTTQIHKLEIIRDNLPELETILVVGIGRDSDAFIDFWSAMDMAHDDLIPVDSLSHEPAFICYTSGTTGNPKGALHAHRTMFGHLTGMEMFHDFLPQPGDLMWTPADWAWMAGLMDILMPGWFHGCKVVATAMKGFDAEDAYRILAQHEVTLALLTPTMLKLMKQVDAPLSKYSLKLRAVLSGGEAVGASLLEWAQKELKLMVHEGFGQTECNVILGNNGKLFPIKPGSLGKPTPGSIVKVINNDGVELAPGEEGHIACLRPDPVMLLEYLNKPEATKEKFIGDWLITGDLGHMDDEGYFWFHGRADDVITSSGYRIGPSEIEDALIKHKAVQIAAAIGVPDPIRTETIKAFIILSEGFEGNQQLEEELKNFVRQKLAKHEVPKEIEFVNSLPMTTTGKIMRKELRQKEMNS